MLTRRVIQPGSFFRTAVVAVLLGAVLAGGRPVSAHEIGTTRVTVRFPTATTFRIEIVTDAQALFEKLPQPASIAALSDLFPTRTSLQFDNTLVTPSVDVTIAPAADDVSPPVATLVLTGDVPDHARELRWTYGWTFATYSLTVERGDGGSRIQWLEGGETSAAVALDDALPSPDVLHTARQYLALGFTHIVPHGADHVLFVLGLFLLGANRRSLLWQVSAFTVAHTLTLGLAIYGVVAVRPALVEPVIALSIAYVAIENVVLRDLRPWRIALVFAFGLLHGLGFAGVLTDVGLPRDQFAAALIAFNLGVEGGQLAVLGAAMLAVGWWRSRPSYRRWVAVPASLAIAVVAVCWTIQRL